MDASALRSQIGSLLALINGQAERELKDQYGYTVLHHSAISGAWDVLVFLINEAKYYRLDEEDETVYSVLSLTLHSDTTPSLISIILSQ